MDSLKIKVRSGARPALPAQYSQQLRQVIDAMLENSQQKRQSVLQLLEHPKVVKMQQLMVEKGLPGAPNNIGPVKPQPTATVPAEQAVEAKIEELKQQFATPKSREEQLREWEDQLMKKEKELKEREERLLRAEKK